MATLTQDQLIAVEQNTNYRDKIRIAALAQAAFQKSAEPAATESWFRNRSQAEIILANPNISIDRSYWAAKTVGSLKNLEVAGITEESTADEIADAITGGQYDTLATEVFGEEAKKIVF